MNIVLKNPTADEYYIASIGRHGDGYVVQGRIVHSNGNLRVLGSPFYYKTDREARTRCKSLAKAKVKHKQHVVIDMQMLPEAVIPWLRMPEDLQMTAGEMIQLIKDASVERYVTLRDNNGLEPYFDVDVEYVAREIDDKDMIEVFDKFGSPRSIFASRLHTIKPTERCEEVRRIGVSVQGTSVAV